MNHIKYSFAIILISTFFSCNQINPKLQNQVEIRQNTVIEKISEQAKQHILVCAHRSFHKNAPENSLLSLKEAISANIDIVELDVRTTKDSILILMHDKTINRTTNGIGLVSEYTFSELQKLFLKISDAVTTHKIPLLSEALKISKGKLIVNLDLKAVNYKQLYKLLQELKMEHEVISFIGKKEKIMEMLSIDSLYVVMPKSKTRDDMIFYFKNTKSSLQHFDDESFTEENMKWMDEKGELVFMNALWDVDKDFINGNTLSIDSIIALMPAIIQTDHPKLLLTYLQRKNLHR